MDEIEIWKWIAGLGAAAVGALIVLLWRHHNRRFDDYVKRNDIDHSEIRESIKEVDDNSAKRHHVVRDLIDKILFHQQNGKD